MFPPKKRYSINGMEYDKNPGAFHKGRVAFQWANRKREATLGYHTLNFFSYLHRKMGT